MIRLARPEEAALLPAIEHDSDQAMRATPHAFIADFPWAPADHYEAVVAAGTAWVAANDNDGQLIGFVACQVHGDGLVVDQLSVIRSAQMRGFGRGLMQAAIDWARTNDQPRIMLTTFIDVSFNAPFYRTLGFEVLASDALPASLKSMLAKEAAMGLDPAKRVGMALAFRGASA